MAANGVNSGEKYEKAKRKHQRRRRNNVGGNESGAAAMAWRREI
jgi:hypothetical protein